MLNPKFIEFLKKDRPDDWQTVVKVMEKLATPEFVEFAEGFCEAFGVESVFINEQPKKEQKNDQVNHPSHYTQASVQLEPIDVLRYAPFDLGNALKYIIRAGHKGDALTDYQKALKYLQWAAESACYNRKPYETFIENYGLQLNKFEVLNGLIVHVYWDSIRNLRDYVETKIKELTNEH